MLTSRQLTLFGLPAELLLNIIQLVESDQPRLKLIDTGIEVDGLPNGEAWNKRMVYQCTICLPMFWIGDYLKKTFNSCAVSGERVSITLFLWVPDHLGTEELEMEEDTPRIVVPGSLLPIGLMTVDCPRTIKDCTAAMNLLASGIACLTNVREMRFGVYAKLEEECVYQHNYSKRLREQCEESCVEAMRELPNLVEYSFTFEDYYGGWAKTSPGFPWPKLSNFGSNEFLEHQFYGGSNKALKKQWMRFMESFGRKGKAFLEIDDPVAYDSRFDEVASDVNDGCSATTASKGLDFKANEKGGVKAGGVANKGGSTNNGAHANEKPEGEEDGSMASDESDDEDEEGTVDEQVGRVVAKLLFNEYEDDVGGKEDAEDDCSKQDGEDDEDEGFDSDKEDA